MNATTKTASSSRTLSPRLLELRKKIQNPEYIEFAVQRIAQVLSRKLVEDREIIQRGFFYESN